MKKKIKIAVIVSIVVNTICLLVNFLGVIFFKTAPFTVLISGGEIVQHIGFGIEFNEIFPLTTIQNQSSITTEMNFNFISLLISLVIIAILVFVIKMLIDRIWRDK